MRRDSQSKSGQKFSGAAGGGKLLGRAFARGEFKSLAIPAGAYWLITRTVGPGGGATRAYGNGGGGGAFAREDRACTPGSTLNMFAYSGVDGADGAGDSYVNVEGTLYCRAERGRAPVGDVGGVPGLAANCFGTIKRSGGAGARQNLAGIAGQFGGPGGLGFSGAGGGSGGETDLADCLIFGGKGSDGQGSASEYGGRGEFPGGGAAIRLASGNMTATAPGGDGFCVVDFWSSKP